jgi:NAD(P)-dependent dehydrogenase (short-subunit alcohol dehydrogenase family)
VNVFLTGASSGIGAALAELYAGKGAVLGLYARRSAAPASLAAKLDAGRHAWYAGDAMRLHCARADDFVARFGLPDVVIANAGILRVGTSTQVCRRYRAVPRGARDQCARRRAHRSNRLLRHDGRSATGRWSASPASRAFATAGRGAYSVH